MNRSVKAKNLLIEYELVQTDRKGSVAFRVLPGGKVCLYTPRTMPLREADRLVAQNAERIEQAKRYLMAYQEKQDGIFDMRDGMRFPLEGRTVTLRLVSAPKFRYTVSEDEVTLYLSDFAPEKVKQALRDALIEHFRQRLSERLAHYVPLIGRSPGKVTIREQKTRWGSCSSLHNLNFNWLLIMAPPEALDYVVIHELCHLYEFNHSPAFWKRVKTYQPDYACWRQWLRSGWNHPFR